MIQIIREIQRLIVKEYQRAIELHGSSPTVGDALTLVRKEVEETVEESAELMSRFDNVWSANRADDYEAIIYEVKQLEETCRRVAAEAVQAGAMCEKLHHAALVATLADKKSRGAKC